MLFGQATTVTMLEPKKNSNLRRTVMLCIIILAARPCVSGDGFLHGR